MRARDGGRLEKKRGARPQVTRNERNGPAVAASLAGFAQWLPAAQLPLPLYTRAGGRTPLEPTASTSHPRGSGHDARACGAPGPPGFVLSPWTTRPPVITADEHRILRGGPGGWMNGIIVNGRSYFVKEGLTL